MTDPRLRDIYHQVLFFCAALADLDDRLRIESRDTRIYVQITRIIRCEAWAMELKFSRFDKIEEIDLRLREAFRDVHRRAEEAAQ